MKLTHALLFTLALSGCRSSAWTVEVVDGGPGNDVGSFLSMHYHAEGESKTLTIVYEDVTKGRIRIATRRGTGSTWDDFETEQLTDIEGQKPSSAMGPDGSVYVAFTFPSRLTQPVTFREYVATPTGVDGAYEHDYVEVNAPLNRRTTDQPATIAYLQDAEGAGKLYVAWSMLSTRHLMLASRDLDGSAWSVGRVGGSESEFLGVRPALLASRDFDRLRMFYGNRYEGASGLVAITLHQLGWQGPFPVGFGAADSARFQAKYVLSDNADHPGAIAVVHADCTGKPQLREPGSNGGPFTGLTVPGIPTDPDRTFCEASFAHDHQGRPYISAYDHDYGGAVVFHLDPGTNAWVAEYPENGLAETGRYTSIVYDPLADELVVAYYDRETGELKVATRDAGSK